MGSKSIILACLFSILVYASAAETNTTTSNDLKTASSSPPGYTVPSSFSDFWRSGTGQVLIVGGAIVSGLAILGGSAYLLAPVFGYRSCSVFGTCEKSAITGSTGGNLQDPAAHANAFNEMQQYGGYSYPSVIGYRKRSIEYLKPVLSTLKTLYEKYEKEQSKQ